MIDARGVVCSRRRGAFGLRHLYAMARDGEGGVALWIGDEAETLFQPWVILCRLDSLPEKSRAFTTARLSSRFSLAREYSRTSQVLSGERHLARPGETAAFFFSGCSVSFSPSVRPQVPRTPSDTLGRGERGVSEAGSVVPVDDAALARCLGRFERRGLWSLDQGAFARVSVPAARGVAQIRARRAVARSPHRGDARAAGRSTLAPARRARRAPRASRARRALAPRARVRRGGRERPGHRLRVRPGRALRGASRRGRPRRGCERAGRRTRSSPPPRRRSPPVSFRDPLRGPPESRPVGRGRGAGDPRRELVESGGLPRPLPRPRPETHRSRGPTRVVVASIIPRSDVRVVVAEAPPRRSVPRRSDQDRRAFRRRDDRDRPRGDPLPVVVARGVGRRGGVPRRPPLDRARVGVDFVARPEADPRE
jgi:hypothetical protein